MKSFTRDTEGESHSNDSELSRECIFNILSNRRRRFTIHALKRMDEPVDLVELSEYVAAWEMNINPDNIEYEDYRSVYMTLRRTHLPKMDEKGIIHFDESAQNLRTTDRLDSVDIYTEVIHNEEIPWSLYYVGVAGISVALLAAVVVGVPGFESLEPLHVGAFTVIVFSLSAIIHHLIDRQNSLGDSERPPELHQIE